MNLKNRIHFKATALDFLWFGWQQALSCLFAVGIFAGLLLSHYYSFGLARYDFMLVLCLVLQVILVVTKLETVDELKVICLFHVIGLALEIYKVSIGSWSYPASGYARIGGVPLYSGFMYAAIASYMCQAWRRFDLRVYRVPMRRTMFIAVLIYANFYTNHFLPDVRWAIVVVALALLRNAWVHFTVRGHAYKMHLVVSLGLMGFFIWIAENFGTLIGAWRYPSQANGWKLVHGSKVGSWSLLIVFSFMLVLWLKSKKTTLAKSA